MTTMAALLASVPLAVGRGDGRSSGSRWASRSRRPDPEPAPDALHHADRVSLPRPRQPVGPCLRRRRGDGARLAPSARIPRDDRRNPALAIRALTAACVLAVNAACTVGPDYVRPPVAAPSAYKEVKDGATGGTRSDIPRGRWWELFGDAELDALEAQVDVDSQTIRAAEARFRQAQALTAAARSRYYPTLGIGGTNQNLGFTVTWELDLWGASGARSRRAPPPPITAAELEAAKLSVQAQVAQNYFCCACRTRKSACCRTASRDTKGRCSSRATSMRSASSPAGRRAGRSAAHVDPGPGARGGGGAGAVRACIAC